MTQTTESDVPRLSRRGLFGAGLGRALDAQLAAFHAVSGVDPAPPPPPAPPPGPGSWREGDSQQLGARLEPARLALLEACGMTAGRTVLDLTAGDGALAELAAHAGANVTAIETDADLLEAGRLRCAQTEPAVEWHAGTPASIKAEGRRFEAVVSNFTASHHPDQRRVARSMIRPAATGAPIAMTAWKGLMARVMTITAPDRPGRSERWSRYDTLRLHFFDFPELEVREHSMPWRFLDSEHAVRELAAPVGTESAHRRLRSAMPDLIEVYGTKCGDGLELRSEFALVFALQP